MEGGCRDDGGIMKGILRGIGRDDGGRMEGGGGSRWREDGRRLRASWGVGWINRDSQHTQPMVHQFRLIAEFVVALVF